MDNVYFSKKMEEMRNGINKYLFIMNNLNSVDVSVYKSEFQTKFNGFYRVRQRSEDWYKTYFAILERNKSNTFLGFYDVLFEMYNEFDRVETSFSSKLLHTVNPNMPIYDSKVIEALSISKIQGDNRFEKALNNYKMLCDKYAKYFQTPNCSNAIMMFDTYFPEYANEISDVKKIDFFLWIFSKRELEELNVFAELLGE